MCKLPKGAQFKMKREKAKRLSILFSEIRFFRDASKNNKRACYASTRSIVKTNIVFAIGSDELQLAKLIYRRAKIAGLM
jgi:hypothetical protein